MMICYVLVVHTWKGTTQNLKKYSTGKVNIPPPVVYVMCNFSGTVTKYVLY